MSPLPNEYLEIDWVTF